MKYLIIFITFIFFQGIQAQTDPKWDDTRSQNWPRECQEIQIKSSLDQKLQAAFFYKSKKRAPLIVSLHTWSGGYDQKDTLSWLAIVRDYNYIHPDFRGPNKQFEACGSPLAIQDIDDAIDYAIEQGNVDTNQIHVIGVSGGGYATLLTYMKSKHQINTFSAWASISNLVDWYYESVGRQQKYAKDIALSTQPESAAETSLVMDEEEAKKRSPYFMPTPVEQRKNSKLFIYAGIHDGYTGSVPISQSVKFYNKLIADIDPEAKEAQVPLEDLLTLLERRNTNFTHGDHLENGLIHYQKHYKDQIQLNIFEGGHELLIDGALDQVRPLKVLALGDSNGALEEGWVNQLRWLRFKDRFYNTSISGNTIGFDNLDRVALNTLSNLDQYLKAGVESLKGLDKILIMLGTNDCKAVFDDRLEEVPKHLEQLLQNIKAHPLYRQYQPKIYVVSPPPYAHDDQLIPKYKGGAGDIAWLFPRFKAISEKMDCVFIDVYSILLPEWGQYSADGIHMKPAAQKLVAEKIIAAWGDIN
ncbi:MAG: GDSL-type esterase/lipase family protein [Saprospiraceae bacterium]